MQDWMIALTVVAGIIVLLCVTIIVGTFVAVRLSLGRYERKPKAGEPEFPAKYGIEPEWYDAVASNTSELEISSFDGLKLYAQYFKHDTPVNKVAVLQHGYHTSPRAMQPYARMFFDRGFDVLVPYARAHGKSEGRYIGMAWLDRFDILRWIDRAVALYGESVKIALLGVSMGGSSVVAAAGTALPEQVRCVIDDCGFSSQFDIFSHVVGGALLPRKLALFPLAAGVRIKCKYSIYDADITALAKKANVPALFIHGDKDSFVPIEQGRKLFEAYGGPKQFAEVEGAVHAACYGHDPKAYEKIIYEFLDRTF